MWDDNILKNIISWQNLGDNAARFKKELEMNIGCEKAQIEIEQDTILNFTKNCKNQVKANLLKIEECERNRARGFMNIMKEVWDDIYENWTMSTQTFRDRAAKFRKDKSLPNLMEVRDRNDVEPKLIQIRDTEPGRIEENFKENESNEEEIMETSTKRKMKTLELWDWDSRKSCIL